jgi:hypothetical protein
MATRILVVDDDPSIRQALSHALAQNADVQVASTAEEALSGLAASSPDVILSDVRMPGLDGIELATTGARTLAGCGRGDDVGVRRHADDRRIDARGRGGLSSPSRSICTTCVACSPESSTIVERVIGPARRSKMRRPAFASRN